MPISIEPHAEEPTIDQDSMAGMYLTFQLASAGYGLEIRYVTEIIGIQPITRVPDLPEHVIGVVNLRGKVIPVIDVRLRFGLPHRDHDERTCIIVVNIGDLATGLVVDQVSEVIDIPATAIEPPPAAKRGKRHAIRGMGKIGQQVKILLDMDTFLEDQELNDTSVATAV